MTRPVTEYTPTEPEIAAALAYLNECVPPSTRPSVVDVADRLTRACVEVDLKLLDDPAFDAPTQVRLARAALVARERWAGQETKAA